MFADRVDAGRRLAPLVRVVLPADARPLVLALPRGGVPVAREVAAALGAPLDVLVVRKLGAPRHPEFAVGALAEGGVRVVDPDAARLAGASDAELERVAAAEAAELERRVREYRGGRPGAGLAGRTVVLVDDGVATGATTLAAVRAARDAGAATLVVAVPVAPAEWRDGPLAAEADALVAVSEPPDLGAVGAYYRDFRQLTDEQVVEALARHRAVVGPEG